MNELSACQGRYEENEPVRLLLRQNVNADRADWCISHLERDVIAGSLPVSKPEQELVLPSLKAGGYGVEIKLYQKDRLLIKLNTAVNVGGSIVRYGFLCDFEKSESDAVSALAGYHITHVQFYDWSWKHDSLVAPQDEYQDMMGKHNSLPAIRKRIYECHQHGMTAMAYGAVYAACRAFQEAHPDWGLYGAGRQPLIFINTFYYMDIDSPWRDHLIGEYLKAVTEVGFDGIHMDTYGEPKTAFTRNGEKRFLRDGFPALIRDTDAEIGRAHV